MQTTRAFVSENQNRAVSVSIGIATVAEIDSLNIFQATMLAMKRAVSNLSLTPTLVLVDGRSGPKLNLPLKTIVHGDQLEKSISAASIIAKVCRDQLMVDSHHVENRSLWHI